MTQQSEREPPEIVSEKDIEGDISGNDKDTALPKMRGVGNLDIRRFSLGENILGWCIFLMLACIVMSFFMPDSELVRSGFEAFKLIVMTVLGYIFGSNQSKNE